MVLKVYSARRLLSLRCVACWDFTDQCIFSNLAEGILVTKPYMISRPLRTFFGTSPTKTLNRTILESLERKLTVIESTYILHCDTQNIQFDLHFATQRAQQRFRLLPASSFHTPTTTQHTYTYTHTPHTRVRVGSHPDTTCRSPRSSCVQYQRTDVRARGTAKAGSSN